MKQSRYNIAIPYGEGRRLLFNGITKKFFFVSENNYDELNSVLSNPGHYLSDVNYEQLLSLLKENGFLTDVDNNEQETIERLFYNYRNSAVYSLMILTTYACNFSCWYCVQNHRAVFLNDETERRIIRHIKKYVNNNIQEFNISWFGGEPLLNYMKIRNITLFAKNYCERQNIPFSCGITTNGSLITRKMAKEMNCLCFDSFQITIDGSKDKHNKTRFNNSISDSFSAILNNIVILTEEIPSANVSIRINYTHDNISDSFPDEVDQILCNVRDKVDLLFRKVWQEDNTHSLNDKLRRIIKKFSSMGYNILHDYDDIKLTSCYVEKKYYNAIFPDGTVDKCSNRDMSITRGRLTESGDIEWDCQPKEINTNIFSIKSDCSDCCYLPLCLGPCPRSREQMDIEKGIKCCYDNKDSVFIEDIKNYVTFKYNER